LGLVGASGPRYGVRRLDAAFAARRPAPRHRPGARLPKGKAEAELPHSKGRAKTTRGVEMPPRFIGALPSLRRMVRGMPPGLAERPRRYPGQKPTAENRCCRYPLLI
jgi:hypothetical protein